MCAKQSLVEPAGESPVNVTVLVGVVATLGCQEATNGIEHQVFASLQAVMLTREGIELRQDARL